MSPVITIIIQVLIGYLILILPLLWLYNRSYLWEAFAPMMALIWPVSLPLVIAFSVYCYVHSTHYRFKHRNDPKIDWAEVFKDGVKLSEPLPDVTKPMPWVTRGEYTGFLRDAD